MNNIPDRCSLGIGQPGVGDFIKHRRSQLGVAVAALMAVSYENAEIAHDLAAHLAPTECWGIAFENQCGKAEDVVRALGWASVEDVVKAAIERTSERWVYDHLAEWR
jgi:hypothetical protein